MTLNELVPPIVVGSEESENDIEKEENVDEGLSKEPLQWILIFEGNPVGSGYPNKQNEH